MKKSSFLLILLALVQCTWAQTNGSASSDVVRTIEHPDFTALFTYDIEIPKVEFSKEQTTLYFDFSHYTGTTFSFRSSTYLVDEEGKRYRWDRKADFCGRVMRRGDAIPSRVAKAFSWTKGTM